MDVVGNLIALADTLAEQRPRRWITARGSRTGTGGRHEQRAGLGAVVERDIHRGLALPGLTRADAERRAHTARHDAEHRRQTLGRGGPHRSEREGFEGGHDQRVPGKHRNALTEGHVHGGLAATLTGVVEAGEIVVNQRRAVQQFDRTGSTCGQHRIAVPAGSSNRQTERRADPRTTGKHRVAQRVRQQWRAAGVGSPVDHGDEVLLERGIGGVHGVRRSCVFLC